MNRNDRYRYSRNLFGLNALGFFSNASDYPGDADIAAFVDAGTEGEIGIFLASNGTLKTDALSAGDEFYVCQIVDGQLKQSPKLTFGTANGTSVAKTAYIAPVFNQIVIGDNGTTGNLGITFSSAAQEFILQVRDLTVGNQPFPVVEANAYVNKPAASADEYDDVVIKLVKQINQNYDFEGNGDEPFVTADVVTSTATSATTATSTYTTIQGSTRVVTSADTTGDFSVGDFISLVPSESDLTQPSIFKIVSITASLIVLDRPWPFAGATVADANGLKFGTQPTDDEFGIRIRTAIEQTNIEVSVTEDLEDATVTEVQAWVQSSGDGPEVHFLEKETQVMDGYTTGNEAFPLDYGQPAEFVPYTTTNNYDLYFISYLKGTPSMAPPAATTQLRGTIILGALTAGGLQTDLDTVLGT